MKTLLTLFAAAALLSAAGPADAVKAAEDSWAKAIVAKDYAALEKILSADLTYTHSDGRRDTKASYIDSIKTGKQVYEVATPQDLEVKLFGNTAVLTGKLKIVSLTNGKRSDPTLSILHVYVKHGAQWQLVAHQSARLP
jgi:ketosteroid isomerase-like protein